MCAKDSSRHPCFNIEASGECGRVHLPVAPRCNIKCNYCNRKYDCVNESRPGVTSAVLRPYQAAEYMERILALEPRITVAGIAGPGDPMANAEATLETIRLLRERHPGLLFCLSSNGLALPPHLDDLAALGVSHVTVTMNAVDPEIGARIHAWVRDGKVVYQGRDAAELLLERQLAAIKGLKERGLLVKVNSIVIPGINEDHLLDVAVKSAELGADIQNLIPMLPTADTPFAEFPKVPAAVVKGLREKAGEHINQMTHCKRCRADAVGLLSQDRSAECSGVLIGCSRIAKDAEPPRPNVAVATREGMLVNLHLGEARELQIWTQGERGFELLETRIAPDPGCGPARWEALAQMLEDCRCVLTAAVGDTPRRILKANGITPVECSGLIAMALQTIYAGGNPELLRGRGNKAKACGGCEGGGGGCG
jgi:nitrogen fixation protein NifB